MWYAPIGSTEYVRNLHNDKKIKEYLLNENRLKNNLYPRFIKKLNAKEGSSSESSFEFRSGVTKRGNKLDKGKFRKDNASSRDSKGGALALGKPMTMKTQSAVLIQIYRSYRKTALDVVSYAKNIKSSHINKGRNFRSFSRSGNR